MLRSRKKIAVLLFVILASAVLYPNRTLLVFENAYIFDSPSDAFLDEQGNLYVIDRSKMDVIKADAAGYFNFKIEGGKSKDNGFYNVNRMAFSEDGRIFIHGLRFEGTSLYLTDERIMEYTSEGRYVGEVYRVSYDRSGLNPRQEGLIRDLTYNDGKLHFVYADRQSLDVFTLTMDGETTLRYSIPLDDAWEAVQDVCIAEDDERVFFTNKAGELWSATVEDVVRLETYTPAGSLLASTPYRLASTAPDSLYFSDLGTWSIRRLNPETGDIEWVYGLKEGLSVPDIDGREIFCSVSVNQNTLITVGDMIHITDLSDGQHRVVNMLPFTASRLVCIAVLWILCLFTVLAGLMLLFELCRYIMKLSFVVKMAVVVVLFTVILSFFISALVISGMNQNIEDGNEDKIRYITALGASLIDGDALSRIVSNQDYMGEDYNKVKTVLDNLLHQSDIYEMDLYYLLYRNIGDIALGVMDSEKLVSPMFPSVIVPEFYNQALLESRTVFARINDLTGMWGLALSPVLNSRGEVAGVLEIGIDMNAHDQFIRGQIINVILNVFAIAVVFILLTVEAAIFIPYLSIKLSADAALKPNGMPYVVRMLTFFLFMAHCLQDTFIPVLAMEAYTPIFGIPKSIGGALPITIEMLAIAVFAVVSGNLGGRFNRRSLMIFGTALMASGFALIAFNSEFCFLVAGKLILGSGVGISITTINSTAAGLPEELQQQAFDGISFGMISGIQVGVIVGSLISGFWGYSAVFLVSSLIALCVLLLTAFLFSPGTRTETSVEKKAPGMLKFLASPGAGGFLFLILIPALTVVSLIEYYIPIFAAESNLTEVTVGQISLVYGIFIIFIGPSISPRIIGRIGTAKSVSLAALIVSVGVGLFAFMPTVPMMLLMVLMYGISQSFGITARYSHFASLREVQAFGSTRAMGTYGMFENVAQSFAPVLITSVMAYGYRVGAASIVTLVVVAFMLYLALLATRKKEKRG